MVFGFATVRLLKEESSNLKIPTLRGGSFSSPDTRLEYFHGERKKISDLLLSIKNSGGLIVQILLVKVIILLEILINLEFIELT